MILAGDEVRTQNIVPNKSCADGYYSRSLQGLIFLKEIISQEIYYSDDPITKWTMYKKENRQWLASRLTKAN